MFRTSRTACELIDVEAIRDLLERARDEIQAAMNLADLELLDGETPTFFVKLDEIRQIVSEFSDTAQHLVHQRFGVQREAIRPCHDRCPPASSV